MEKLKILMIMILRKIIEIIPKDPQKIYVKQIIPHKDNISAIIDELIKSNKIQKYIIIFDCEEKQNYVNSRIRFVKTNTIRSVWHYITSKYIICDNGLYGSVYSTKQIFVNTTHGMICKNFGYLSKEAYSERKECQCLPKRVASYIVASSPFFIDIISKGYAVPQECILTTGLPRNDYFFDKETGMSLFNEICGNNYKKTIIWMATYRKSNKARSKINGHDYEIGIPLLTKENIYELNKILSKENVVLVIKYHAMQNEIDSKQFKLSNIKLINSDLFVKKNIPLYSFVTFFDALITDYSSIYYDYLILNRPICHIVDDYQEYEKTRGFAFDNMIDLFPGELAYTCQDIANFISDIANDIDKGYAKRNKMADLFVSHRDNYNAKRLLEAINII